MSSKRVIFFGGQGSRSLYRSRPALATDMPVDPPAVSLLLSTCHTAFLGEVIRAQSQGSLPTWADFEAPRTPELLLTVPLAQSNNPIFQGVCLCVNQLVGYLRYDTTLEKLKQAIPIGFCSGMLPAVILATSNTTEDFIRFSGEAVRLAFWIGYRAAELSQQISSDDRQVQSWALSVFGKDDEKIEKDVRDFNERVCESSQIRVGSRFGKASFSLVGPGHALEAFRVQHSFTPFTSEMVHIHALYHGGYKALNTLNTVLEDVRRGNILFPSSMEMKRPIWSCHDASMVDAATFTDDSLLQYTLRLILLETADLYNTWLSIINDVSSSDHDLEIVTVGPGSNALLASVCRDIPQPTGTVWTDIPGASQGVNSNQVDGFAIIGMSVNFPLGAGKDAFWEMIETGLNAAQEIPGTRFHVNDYKPENRNGRTSREMKASHGNFLTNPFEFDHEYFGISPREAKSMDPQQKLLLQGAVHAMDDAGYVPNGTPSFNPETMGCYIGVATDDYVQNLASEVDVYYSTGTLRAFLSGKISYTYGWSGPSVVIDTACSSSLVSVVMACRALAHGDCTTALAGGVNAITSPDMYLGLSRAHFLSPTGQCKPFDISADGYCRAEGCGLFVIKRLSDAVHEGDRIYGVIKEADVNQCGNASSITHPHRHTQKQLFQKLLSRRNMDASSISVIEAHGTGTQAGDATEASSIGSTFGGSPRPVYLTSVKGNIGHAEAASGAAGLAKLLMMLRFSKIPAQVGFNTLNPKLENLIDRNIHIPTVACEWERIAPNLPRRALLNNFGAAGSNAALIIEEYRIASRRNDQKWSQRAAYLLTLSARSAHALRELIDCYSKLLRSKQVAIQDVCYTATARRQKHQHILSISGGTIAELVDQLQLHRQLDSSLANYGGKHPVVFVFSGQGSFYSGMGQQLMVTAPVFKSRVKDCDRVLQQNGFDVVPSRVLDGSFCPESAPDLVLWSQVSCFVLEYALACLWISWNIKPDVVIGHSLGEYAAMVISGALSLQDALLLIVQRAQLMASMCQIGQSTMLACNTSTPSIEKIIADSGLSQLTVACDNSVMDSVVSGPVDQVDQLAQLVKEKRVCCKRLDVPLGFHSPALDAVLPELQAKCEGLSFASPSIPLGSCFHGRLIEEGDLNSSYPVQQTRGLVRFTELIDSLFKQNEIHNASFIEIGPNPITLPMIRAKFSEQDALFLPSIAKSQDPWDTLSRALQQLTLRYNSIQWRAIFDGTDAHIVDLPDYPFQTHSLYVPFKEPAFKETVSSTSRLARPPVFHLLQNVVDLGPEKELSTFSTSLDALSKYMEGHLVDGFPLCPASVYHEMVLEAMHSEAAPTQDRLAVVSDIHFGHPLVYSPERKLSTVLLVMGKPPVAVPESNHGDFKFALPTAPGCDSETILCTGQTAWMSLVDAKAYLARKAAYANRQMRLLKRNQSQTNTLHRNVIYNTIFPRVVAYSEPYQSITELHVAEGDLDGYGKFEVPASTLNGGIISPVFIDTMLHAAGFVANSQAKPTDAFICSKVESTVVLYTDINPRDTFLVYCSLLEDGDGELIGEAFAMTLEGKAVASIEGMVFKRLNLRSFANHLSRQGVQLSTGDIRQRPVLPRSKPSTTATRPSVPRVVDPMVTVVDLLSKLCEQPREMITPDKRLVDLGIDSLMQIEFSNSLMAQFPHIDTNGVMKLESVQDIQQYIVDLCGSQPEVSFTHDESNSDSSSTTTSGRLTPSTEFIASPKDVTSLLMQLVADTCELHPSEVSQNMALESLGMDSLMAIEFQEGMKKEFGKTLAQEVFSPAMKIGELAKILSANIDLPCSEDSALLMGKPGKKTHLPQPRTNDFVVHLQQGPQDLPPLIMLHDGSGLIEKYKSLPILGCNVFGIRNAELALRPHWAIDLEGMASRYVALIASVVKSNQVILAGWSFGGVLAHEVSQQLDKKGYTTVAVILIDSPCPLNHQPLPSQVVDYILGSKNLPQTTLNNISFQFESHARILAEYSIQNPIPLARKYVMLHSKQVLETTRLCGVSYPWLESQQYRALNLRQWEGLLGRSLAVYDIPGNHFEPFNQENVKIVSQKLKKAYNKAVELNGFEIRC